MIEIRIENLAAIEQAFRQLADRTGNLRPALDEIGEHLAETTKHRFQTSTSPEGRRWAENKPSTLASKRGNLPLVREGDLQDEIYSRATGSEVTIGSPMIYAATHQFGARRGSFGNTGSGVPIPWGTIPARPFLGVSTDDARNILDILGDHLEQAIR